MAEETSPAAAAATASVEQQAAEAAAKIKADAEVAEAEAVRKAKEQGADEQWLESKFKEIADKAEAREKKLMEWFSAQLATIQEKLAGVMLTKSPEHLAAEKEAKEREEAAEKAASTTPPVNPPTNPEAAKNPENGGEKSTPAAQGERRSRRKI